MRKLAIMAALASTALATPAVARDNSWYVGVDAGAMIVEDTKMDFSIDDSEFIADIDDAVIVDYGTGLDIGLLGGYDFGGFRLEGELAWKRANIHEATLDPGLIGGTSAQTFDVDGHGRVFSAMVNGMLDFGDDDGWSGFVGIGGGLAKVKLNVEDEGDEIDADDSDGVFAWQVMAGVRRAVSANIDLGLKYRFFTTTTFKLGDVEDGGRLEGR